MRMYTAQDIENLIQALPQSAENQSVYQALCEMRDENSVDRQPYTYEVDFSTGVVAGSTNLFPAPTAAGALSITGNFIVDTAAPFMLVSSTFQADAAGAAVSVTTRPSPNAVIIITDQSSGRSWMNAPVPIPSLFGNAQLPYFWPQPRLIPGNSNISMTCTNYDAAQVTNFRLSFHGYRFYSTRQS